MPKPIYELLAEPIEEMLGILRGLVVYLETPQGQAWMSVRTPYDSLNEWSDPNVEQFFNDLSAFAGLPAGIHWPDPPPPAAGPPMHPIRNPFNLFACVGKRFIYDVTQACEVRPAHLVALDVLFSALLSRGMAETIIECLNRLQQEDWREGRQTPPES